MKIGLVGIAALYWPYAMANGIKSIKGARLVSFATLGIPEKVIKDHLGATSDEYAAKYGLKKYISADDMMRNEALDALIICTRHSAHADWVERMAKYRKDLYVLKSFATTMPDADRIVRAGKKYGIKIAVGPSARFLPMFAAAKAALDTGKIGRPFSLQVTHHHGVIDVFNKNDFYRDAREGGPELSLGWYVIDLALYFMGQPVKTITAAYDNYTSPASPFMDCGRIVMRMKDNALASCNMYFCNRVPYPSWEMEVLGPKGAILVRQPAGGETSVTLHTAKGVEQLPLPKKALNWEVFWVDHFMRNKKLDLDAAYGRELTRLSLLAREAARKGGIIHVTR